MLPENTSKRNSMPMAGWFNTDRHSVIFLKAIEWRFFYVRCSADVVSVQLEGNESSNVCPDVYKERTRKSV